MLPQYEKLAEEIVDKWDDKCLEVGNPALDFLRSRIATALESEALRIARIALEALPEAVVGCANCGDTGEMVSGTWNEAREELIQALKSEGLNVE